MVVLYVLFLQSHSWPVNRGRYICRDLMVVGKEHGNYHSSGDCMGSTIEIHVCIPC